MQILLKNINKIGIVVVELCKGDVGDELIVDEVTVELQISFFIKTILRFWCKGVGQGLPGCECAQVGYTVGFFYYPSPG